jgi:hypothetical protein
MKNTARIQKRLILLIAFSIIWIFIGSLVIFHQEQVMGKSFKVNTTSFIVPKTKDDKSSVKCLLKLVPDNSQNLILAVLNDFQREQIIAGTYSLSNLNDDDGPVPVYLVHSLALRAPPQA